MVLPDFVSDALHGAQQRAVVFQERRQLCHGFPGCAWTVVTAPGYGQHRGTLGGRTIHINAIDFNELFQIFQVLVQLFFVFGAKQLDGIGLHAGTAQPFLGRRQPLFQQ